MRLRIESIRLVGAERYYQFAPGLNIIVGSIATGKSTLQRCMRGLLGSGLENFSHEAKRAITSLAGELLIGDQKYDVIRPFTTTRTAIVDIAGNAENHRFPVLQLTENYALTYGSWLLQKLDLPLLEVSAAPTQPDSSTTPVTINDYLMYCTLQQGEIDNNVFGHTDAFKNIKRKYVFEILYGKYSIEIARLRDDLRAVALELRRLQDQTKIFQEFLAGTPFENQAQIEKERHDTANLLRDIESQAMNQAEQSQRVSGSSKLRETIQGLDSEISDSERQFKAETDSQEQLNRLLLQLQNQSKRLTRSIVADELLVDFDFLVCPRCGSSLETHETSAEICYLCKQEIPTNQISKEDLIKEQDRLERQIDETHQLIGIRKNAISRLQEQLRTKNQERDQIAKELDFATRSYVSEQASHIAETASRRGELRERLRSLDDILQLFVRFSEAQQRIAKLEAQKRSIEAQIDSAMSSLDNFEERVRYLEEEFRKILNQFKRPLFPDPGITGIDRNTYLPKLDGRRFDELQSQGLKVMVNVAHALAHQLTAFKFGLKLPNILFIDGLTGNMGYEGLDQERIESIYQYLISISQQFSEQLQIIVVDNSIPAIAKQFIKVELGEDNKLIPASCL
jgi:energy-coupling factor transporter ATP-binding protein EcfA2